MALTYALLVAAACGRPPAEPTALPLGTRVAQPTPDFGASGGPEPTATTPAGGIQESIRTRLAQQLTQTPAPTDTAPSPTLSSSGVDPGLSVFSLPTALGILTGGGALFAAPGGGPVANLELGMTVTITGRSADGGWYAAYLADGTAGWVSVAQVRIFGDAGDLQVVQESLGPAVVATLIAEANKPPDPVGTVVAKLTPTTASTAASTQGTAAPAATPSPTGPLITVVVEGANVRAGPGTEFEVVGGLYQEEQARLLGRSQAGDWLQVELPDSVGWIFAPLVEASVPLDEVPVVEP